MNIHAAITVQGLVQGVGYRWFANQHAQKLNLKGFVENKFDGTVYLEVEGDRSLVEELITQLKIGPRNSQVKDIHVEWKEPKNLFLKFIIKA